MSLASYHATDLPLIISGWISWSRSFKYASWNAVPVDLNLISQCAMNAFKPSPSNSVHDGCSSKIGDDRVRSERRIVAGV